MLHLPGQRSASLFAVAAILVATVATAPLATAEEGGEKKILLIGHELDHAWGTHMYLPTCELLAKCLRQTPGVEAVVSDGWPKDKKELAGVDAIVLYSSPGGELLLDGEQAAEVDRLLKQGVGLVCIHWATGLKKENEKRLGKQWMGMLGGMWLHFVGLKIDDSNLKQLNPAHPICNGWEEYELNDEFYLNTQVAPGAETLLEVEVDGKRVPVAWTYERPISAGGRSFGTTLGHFHRNFGLEAFRKLMVGGILWAAHVPLPAGGPPVAVSREDLKLPPKPKPPEAKKDTP
jgi:type 1 glutamine amidotransferase